MKNRFTLVIGVIVVAVLAAYMFTYQVRYDEVVVVTTFDKASEKSIRRDAGLYIKWPWPIQKVHRYSKRIRLLENQSVEQQTKDNKSVIVRTYLTWVIDDPLAFFSGYQENEKEAEDQLSALVNNARNIISEYDFGQLVTTDPAQLKLAQMEEAALKQVQAQLQGQAYGMRVLNLGIRRIVLPEKVTEDVFERMRTTRTRLAEEVTAAGGAEATRITSEAEGIRDRILTFVDEQAELVRTEGEREAADLYARFKGHEELAIFLRQVETLRATLGNNATLFFDANKVPPFDMFRNGAGGGTGSDARGETATEPEAGN